VAACDLSSAARDRIAQAWDIPVFDDYGRMLAEAAPQVVIVATPPDTHRDLALAALRSGAHVVCEKPFVSSLREADEVIRAAGEAGRGIALNHEFREMPIFRAVRREVESGADGPLRFLQLWQLLNRPPSTESGWRSRLARRTLYEAGVHLVDLALALFGEAPVAVQATTSSGGTSDEAADAIAIATLEFPAGRLAQIVQDRLSPGETQYFELRADLERASLRASFGGRARVTAGLFRSTRPHVRVEFGVSGLAWKEVGTTRSHLARNPKDPNMTATRAILVPTLDAFRRGTPPPVDGRQGRTVLEVIAACYLSADTGRRVRLDEATRAELLGFELGAARP
jgi:predicted dehydrogenase